MDVKKAILTFAQSEKIKAGLIMASQILPILEGLQVPERDGAQKVIGAILNMIGHETSLAKNVIGDDGWDEIGSLIDRAVVMVNSGVGHEATMHLSKALSKTTNYGQQSMSFLQEKGLV
jgi:hypothetical protein